MSALDALFHLGIADLVDIAVVSVILYSMALVFRRTRAASVLIGILVISGLFLAARVSGLRLVAFLFQGFFTVILVVLVVIFQEELRRLFEQVAVGSFRRRGRKKTEPFSHSVEALTTVLTDLAREKIGALIVLEGRDTLSHHVHGGIELDGRLSVAVLKSVFDPHSIGHDGAVIVVDDRISQFSCHLPLSTDAEQLAGRGTRHAAALGLAECTDALCLVVSEERGTMTTARRGRLTPMQDVARLAQLLESFYRHKTPQRKAYTWTSFFRRNLLLKLASVCVAVLLWFFFVHESAIEYRTLTVPVRHATVPSGLVVEETQPPAVQVVVSAPRRSLYFLGPEQIDLTVKLFEARKPVYQAFLTASDLRLPDGITFVNILPRTVLFTIGDAPPPTEQKAP